MTWQRLNPEEERKQKLNIPYQVLSLVLFVGLNLSVPLVIQQFIEIDYHWYSTLVKPSVLPPPWFFGQITWIVLDTLIALSGWIVYIEGSFSGGCAAVYVLQALFHFMWVPIFFAGHQLFMALVDSVLQWCMLVMSIVLYRKVNVYSSLLLLPAFAWVCVAATFNAALWYLNQK